MDFRPTLPPPGRLVRLGLILDARDGWAHLSETARMCDGSGIDALWLQDRLASSGSGADGDALPKEAWTVLSVVSRDVHRARMGAILNPASRPPALLAAMARTLDDAIGGRLELSLTAGSHEPEHLGLGLAYPDEVASWSRVEGYAAIVRGLVSGPTVAIAGDTPVAFDVAARVADDVVLPPSDPAGVAHLVDQVHEACGRNSRDVDTMGIAVVVPVSIGRTTAEASARADTDDRLRRVGDPRQVGVFGTLEQCQERVIELAHVGVTDLRCVVPNAPDMPDVLAQLTSISIGTVDVLTPGSPRSKSPDPPEGWGGRS